MCGCGATGATLPLLALNLQPLKKGRHCRRNRIRFQRSTVGIRKYQVQIGPVIASELSVKLISLLAMRFEGRQGRLGEHDNPRGFSVFVSLNCRPPARVCVSDLALCATPATTSDQRSANSSPRRLPVAASNSRYGLRHHGSLALLTRRPCCAGVRRSPDASSRAAARCWSRDSWLPDPTGCRAGECARNDPGDVLNGFALNGRGFLSLLVWPPDFSSLCHSRLR